MRKFRSEACEAIYDEFVADLEAGRISEAEFKEFEEDAFVECANEVGDANEDDTANAVGEKKVAATVI